MKKVVNVIWALIWRKWLWNSYDQDYEKVIKVKGWRTAIVQDKSAHRRSISPCFGIFN
jgi:hypothetical protein